MNWQVRLTYVLARRAPTLLRPVIAATARAAARDPEAAADRVSRTRPPEDRAVLARPEVHAAVVANLPEQFRDVDSILHELRLAVAPWGFPLHEIAAPTQVRHGERDDVHTPAMARQLVEAIPGAALRLEPSYATFDFFDDADLLVAFRRWATS